MTIVASGTSRPLVRETTHMLIFLRAAQARLRNRTKTSAKKLGKDRRGAAALEYTLLSAGMAVAVILGVSALGGGLSTKLSSMGAAIQGTSGTPVAPTPAGTGITANGF